MSKRIHLTLLSMALLVEGACVGQLEDPTDPDVDTDGDAEVDQIDALAPGTFVPTDDAFVESSHASTNYGSATSIGGWVGATTRTSFLKFTVTASAPIATAKLRCHVTSTGASKNGPAIYAASASWAENTVTWNTRPATSGAAIANISGAAAGAWVEWNVLAAVPAAGGVVSLAMVSDSDDGMYCDSSETGANGPQLVITTTTPTPTDPPPTPGTTAISCPAGRTEVFRDDFNGTALDTTRWSVANQATGGGTFTQLTNMLRERVSVSNGTLKIAAQRHCSNPYQTAGTAEHAGSCGGTNYYSGGWITGKVAKAPGKGLMVFRAKMPSAARGIFPALWARNTHSWDSATYGEFDLIEQWWDGRTKGVQSDVNEYSSTTWIFNGSSTIHSNNNLAGPFTGLATGFHIWEVEWDATVTPAVVRYYYRDQPGATRSLARTLTYQSAFSGSMTDSTFKKMINDEGCTGGNCGWRPYIDFAVQPDSSWHVGPDSASTFDPTDLEVDSVITCQ